MSSALPSRDSSRPSAGSCVTSLADRATANDDWIAGPTDEKEAVDPDTGTGTGHRVKTLGLGEGSFFPTAEGHRQLAAALRRLLADQLSNKNNERSPAGLPVNPRPPSR